MTENDHEAGAPSVTARFCPYCGQPLPGRRSTPVTSRIIDYRQLIAQSTKNFVGREWVRAEVDRFLRDEHKSMFLLLGEPGCGKTTFMAQLVKERGYPHHFIGASSQWGVAGALDWRDPVRFAESVGYQLLRDYGGWIMDWERWGIHVSQKVKDLEGLLIGVSAENFDAMPRPADQPAISVSEEIERFGPAAGAIGVYIENFRIDLERVVSQLLVEPLRAIANRWPGARVVIVIDGLDEAAEYSAERNIFKVLPNGSLPSNVRLLLSSQPGPHLSRAFLHRAWPCWLSQSDDGPLHPGALLDAEDYVRHLAEEPRVHTLLRQRNLAPDDFSKNVAEASGGNFLYLHHYADGLKDGDETLLDLDALPQGLYGIYADYLSKIAAARQDVSWTYAYKQVLGTLAVAQAPLSSHQIGEFAEVDPAVVGTILSQLRRFLDVAGEWRHARYSIYHPSFSRYLVSPNNQDTISGPAAHRRITDFYLTRYAEDWTRCEDLYGLDHVVHHLIEAGLDRAGLEAALGRVLTVPFMETRADQADWHMPFVQDLEKVEKTAPSLVIAPCLRILRGTHRNSLTNQETLRLLRRVHGILQDEGKEWPGAPGNDVDQALLDAVAALSLPPGEAVARLQELRTGATNAQVQGALLLALGETGSQEAFEILHDRLLLEERHTGWSAADGFLSLNTPELMDPQLLDTLVTDFGQVQKHPIKQRILYVVGRLHVTGQLPERLPLDTALNLTQQGLNLRANSKVRAIDMIWQLLPESEEDMQRWTGTFEPWLCEKLGAQRRGQHYMEPVWSGEWLQKRLVTALGRIGSPAARLPLEHLGEKVKARPPRVAQTAQGRRDMDRQRSKLKAAIDRALDDLHRRHL